MKGKAHWRSEYAGGTKRQDEKRETGKQHARWFATTVRWPNYKPETVKRSLKGQPPHPIHYTQSAIHPSVRPPRQSIKSAGLLPRVLIQDTHTGIVARGCREIGTKKESRCIQETLVCVCVQQLLVLFFFTLPFASVVPSARSANITIYRCNMTQEKREMPLFNSFPI